MAARLVQSAAGPLDRPTAAFVLAVAAVASNCASKAPVCVGTGLLRQIPALVKQLGAVTEMAAVPLLPSLVAVIVTVPVATDRKSTRLNSSHVSISYAVFCLKKKKHKCLRATEFVGELI